LYAKIVTLAPTHWPATNAIMRRNRRVGTSLSGVAQFLAGRGVGALHEWCSAGYEQLRRQDGALSEKFGVPRSVKTTCIKPSGTVSLLAGSTPGMHFPESRFYLRRVRLAATSNLVPVLRRAGINVEVKMNIIVYYSELPAYCVDYYFMKSQLAVKAPALSIVLFDVC
jgi:ribonucleoside-triphosphate reductase (thioredoxin)